MGLWGLKMG